MRDSGVTRRLLHGVLAVVLLLGGILLIINGVPEEISRQQLWGYHIAAIGGMFWGAVCAARVALQE